MTNLLTFLVTAVCLVLIILVATYIINIPTNDYEKHSSYECGFEPFGDARGFFDIHFYTIGLLFIIFDLEIVFLLPFVIDIANLSILGYVTFIIFMLVVLVGFYYEWSVGLLNWVPQKVSASKTLPSLAIIGVNLEIVSGIDLVFSVLWCLIILSLLLNQLNNLVYRILNLAWLSLLVVALWSYYIDLSFLFIVYILAFVGAVVMLFLSVVLMLPASVVSSDSQTSFAALASLVSFESPYFVGLRLSDVLVFFVVFILLNALHKQFFKDAVNYLNFASKAENFIVSNFRWFRKNFRGFKDYFGLGWSIDDLNYLTSTVEKQNKLEKRFYPILYWYDFLYYLHVNLENTLYDISRDDQVSLFIAGREPFSYRSSLWGVFRNFEATSYISKVPAVKRKLIVNGGEVDYVNYGDSDVKRCLWANCAQGHLDFVSGCIEKWNPGVRHKFALSEDYINDVDWEFNYGLGSDNVLSYNLRNCEPTEYQFNAQPGEYYIPFRFKYSLFNILKPIYFSKLKGTSVETKKYESNVSTTSSLRLLYGRLMFIASLIEFFIMNAVLKLSGLVKTLVERNGIHNVVRQLRVVKAFRTYFGFDLTVEEIRSVTNYEWKRKLLFNRFKVVMYVHDLQYYVYTNVDARLYAKNWELAHRYDCISRLWGSLFDKFEVYSTATSIPPQGMLLNIQLYTPPTLYIPYRLKYSPFNILPPIYELRPGQYFKGNTVYVRVINYLVFVKCFVEFFVCNTALVLWSKLKLCNYTKGYDVLKGLIILVSVLLLGAPLSFNKGTLNAGTDISNRVDADGLLAIKKVLYEYSPELAIVSVIVLLVALIGSAVFTRSRTKSK